MTESTPTHTSSQQAKDEAARLKALRETGLLDSESSAEFDQLTQLCQLLFDVPIVAVSMVDEARQWFKSQVGLSVCETPRGVAFCDHAVSAREHIEVHDAAADARFKANPLVTGAPHIRFYSGFPIFSEQGHVLGTLCIIDTKPRTLTSKQRELQRLLTRQAEVLVRRYDEQSQLMATQARLEEQDKLLQVLLTGLTDYSALMSGDRLWTFLEQALRDLTDSQYALIGECIAGTKKLKIHAITDLSWDEPSRRLLEQLRAGQMTLSNPDTMLGQVFAQGQTLISNEFAQDPRRGGQPEGHPPLHNYVGVPIMDGDEILGMFALANSSEAFSQQTVGRLKPFTATCALLIRLYRQLEERERANKELQQAKDAAETASRAKNDFLSSMSHELRTPLNSVLGYAQLLVNSKKQPLPERQRNQVEQIYKSGQHLLALINEVLDLAKIEAGQIPLSIESISLHDAATEAVNVVQSISGQYGVRVEFDPRILPKVRVDADYTRTKQVLMNLLSNAVKYNREGGYVRLHWALNGELVHIQVKDNGIGIAKDKISQLFQPFNRLGAENSSIEGTGVGLSITRTLTELMAGNIEAESVEGEGTVFHVTLPMSKQQDTSIDELKAGSDAEFDRHIRVLYIEDNPANQRLMEDIFSEHDNFELTCAHDAQLGLQLARQLMPELILMDINLPGLNGFEALEQIRMDESLQHISVAALSANAMEKDVRRGLDQGFDAYLTKPLAVEELYDLLQHIEAKHDDASSS